MTKMSSLVQSCQLTLPKMYAYLEDNGYTTSVAIDIGYMIKDGKVSFDVYKRAVKLYCDVRNIRPSDREYYIQETRNRL